MHRIPPPLKSRRAGMTLIELLVVIAIIAILASLLTVGVIALRGGGTAASNRWDLQKLEVALDKFKAEKGFFPPSKIILYAASDSYYSTPPTSTTLGVFKDVFNQLSLQYVEALWPGLRDATTGKFTNVAWAGPTTMPSTGVILEGDQCLVFFLGGIPNGPGNIGLQGFSNNPADPSTAGGERKRYFEFDNNRLVYRNGNPFPSYNDAFGVAHNRLQPFMYFSSGRRANGYDASHAALGVSPYYQQLAPLKYHNANSFQLISAGANGVFGPGGLWVAASAGAIGAAGQDDMTNFYDKLMGTP